MARTVQVVFDCADVGVMTEFWSDALGYVEQPPPPGYDSWEALLTEMGVPEELWDTRGAMVDPDSVGPRVFLQKVPEGKTAKNRVHLDIRVSTPGEERRPPIDAEAARLQGRGATIAWVHDEDSEYHVVMRDPEGNEFCVT
jgi:catechol 2,3-dioxygenase-like lactoylglutathione lyase family enzyme